ncbi:MAG TPA: 2Fe-2S iron-sulfur cluster-binding protein [Polyangia bacterium]|jgi:NADH dehydrogenase/NADH:ubiquinone oxidoreductase 75 kD subunit (chain G)|nr:2Fe-2S iron-sulfur cluster-binding protein [Polyangia bacterium]
MAAHTQTPPAPPTRVKIVIDGQPHEFPAGLTILEACQRVGIAVPFFCWHPGLSAPAVCRQCLVEIKGFPKPVPSCYTPVADKMEVVTNSPKVLEVRRQMLEFTLLNHPIDCPICDKAGECMLQKHYFDWDARFARNDGSKLRKAKVVDVGRHIVLDQERCILCTRCIRVCNEVARQPDLVMAFRGDRQLLTTAPGRRLDNPYSLNTVDVCPVGALTAKDFRFSMRAWELWATPSVCPGCATGCNIEIHAARDRIRRLVPRLNPAVNKYWMCDEGRLSYKPVHQDRLVAPMVAGAPAKWDAALAEAARLLAAARDKSPATLGVVLSAHLTNEDLFAFSRLATEDLRIDRVYLAGAEQGSGDDILVSADKNPNTTGARLIGGPTLRTAADLKQDLEAGILTALLVVGEANALGPFESLQTLVVLASHRGPPEAAAQVVLPLGMWAEVDGSFTNRQGKVQRLHAAVAPAGQSRPGWETAARLGRGLGAGWTYANAKQVFTEACDKIALMSGADWGKPETPVQLRFANSRG